MEQQPRAAALARDHEEPALQQDAALERAGEAPQKHVRGVHLEGVLQPRRGGGEEAHAVAGFPAPEDGVGGWRRALVAGTRRVDGDALAEHAACRGK